MRLGALLVFVASTAVAQTARVTIPLDAEWIGVVEFRDSRGTNLMPVTATLTLRGAELAGTWRARRGGASGELTGTIDDKGRVSVTATFFGGAVEGGTTVATERCQGRATFDGALHPAGVFRWTAGRVAFSTAASRARGTDCEDLTRLVWTLQPQH